MERVNRGSISRDKLIETYVGAQHDGRLLGSGEGDHLDVPGVGCHGVGDIAHDLTGEAFLAIRIDNAEGDGLIRIGDDGEVALQSSELARFSVVSV